MTEPAFDELLRRLTDAEVRFVLVGGLALNAWGVVRGTKDVDVVVSPDDANLNRLTELAVELGGHVQAPDALLSTPISIAARLASGERVQIETRLGSLDIVQGLSGVPSFEELEARAHLVEVLGVKLPVCSLDDLRSMKQAAGRSRDLADLDDLDAAYGPE